MLGRERDYGRTLEERRPYPGGQFPLREFRLGAWLFTLGFALAVAAIVQSLVKAQSDICYGWLPALCRLKLFDGSDALTVSVALMALFYTRKQIVDAQLPYISYEGSAERRATSSLPPGETFHIVLKNSGSGIAIVQRATFHLRVGDWIGHDMSYDDVLARLAAEGLLPERHFILRRTGRGYGLAKDGELQFFEILRDHWAAIHWLDCDLDFRDVGGRLYRKHVFLVPRDRAKRF
jgi:hypothetical protein